MQRYVAEDGISIAYEQWNEAGSGPPVVLHHGFAANRHLNWVVPGLVRALVDAGKRVIALDARGHGESDKPHEARLYGEARMALDLVGLLRMLEVTSYDLVGYSMGAVVASLAAMQDARVRRLAIGGVGASLVEQGGVDLRRLPGERLAEALEVDQLSEVADEGARAMRGFVDAVGGDRKALAAQARAMHRGPIPLHTLSAPILLLVGTNDLLAEGPERLAAAIPGAKLELLPTDHLTTVGHPRYSAALIEHLA